MESSTELSGVKRIIAEREAAIQERDAARELAAGYLWGRVVLSIEREESTLAEEVEQFLEPEFAENDWLREAVRKVVEAQADISRIMREAGPH